MAGNSNRMNKVNEELKKEIGMIIAQDLKDPQITGLVSVTDVKTTPDFRYARVYVSMINARSNKGNLARLKKCSGFIRSLIAKRVNLRITPQIVFELDDSSYVGSKIDNILKEIKEQDEAIKNKQLNNDK